MESGWKDATMSTIERLHSVWSLNPELSFEEKRALMVEARALTLIMGVSSGSRYWNMLTNTLRILVAAECPKLPASEKIFTEDSPGSDDEIERAFKARGHDLRTANNRRIKKG